MTNRRAEDVIIAATAIRISLIVGVVVGMVVGNIAPLFWEAAFVLTQLVILLIVTYQDIKRHSEQAPDVERRQIRVALTKDG